MHCENRAVGGRDTKILNITQCDYACVSINLCVWEYFTDYCLFGNPIWIVLSRTHLSHSTKSRKTSSWVDLALFTIQLHKRLPLLINHLLFDENRGEKSSRVIHLFWMLSADVFFSAAAFFSYFLSFFFLFMSDILYNVRLGQQRSCKSMCCDGKE